MVVTIYMATVLFQDGGPSADEAFSETELFGSRQDADAFIAGVLRKELENSNAELPDDMPDEDVEEVYLDAALGCFVPSATWDVEAKQVAVPDDPRLAVATEALSMIHRGSSVTGRWVDERGHCPDMEDEHKPDAADAPAGCHWEPYTKEDQQGWVSSIAAVAGSALESIKGGAKITLALIGARCYDNEAGTLVPRQD